MSANQAPPTRLGLVRCEHCGRQFNPHSAARHIPWCANKQADSKKIRLSHDKRLALERYRWRVSYRPSNLNQASPIRRPAAGQPDQKQRWCSPSLNSSATASSASASCSSAASLASQTTGRGQWRPHQASGGGGDSPAGARHHRASEAPQQSQLKRSISSLTLTRLPASGGGGPSRQQPVRVAAVQGRGQQEPRTRRAQSVSNLASMGQLVESLARRVEQIFAQNQALLACIPAGKQHWPPESAQARLERGADSKQILMCHNCKSSCLEEANFCHECGCKVKPC